MSSAIVTEAAEQMAGLPYRLQKKVLGFIRELIMDSKGGVSGKSLLKYAGTVPSDDLEKMSEAIEND